MIAYSSIVARSYSVIHPRSSSHLIAAPRLMGESAADVVGACDESAGGMTCAACGGVVEETTTSTPLVLPPVGNSKRPCSALGSFLQLPLLKARLYLSSLAITWAIFRRRERLIPYSQDLCVASLNFHGLYASLKLLYSFSNSQYLITNSSGYSSMVSPLG